MSIVKVSDKTLQETVAKDELVLVDFWAAWCGPCRLIGPVLDEVAEEAGDKLTIAKLNVDEYPQAAAAHGVMSIPTLKLFKNGEEVDTVVGFQGKKEIMGWIEHYMN